MRRMLGLLLLLLLVPAVLLTAGDFSYVLKRGDSSYTMAGSMNIDAVVAITKRWKGDFLWVRLNAREYLIRDAATLAAVRKAFVEVDAIHEECEKIAERMKPVERRHDALEERIDDIGDAISDDDGDDLDANEIAKLEAELRRLREQIRPLERELRILEEEEERLDEKTEKLEEAAERKLEDIIRRAIRSGVAQPL